MNQIYVDVCGGGLNNKKRMFGTGNLARAVLSQGSSSDGGLRGNVYREALQNEIAELRQQLVTEKAELRQQLGAELQQWIVVIKADRRSTEEAFQKQLQERALLIQQVLAQQAKSSRRDDDNSTLRS